MQAPQWLVFGPFRLDRRDERLWQGEAVIPVRPKTLAVLCALVAQAGQLMTRDALFATVWPETVVSEAVLTVAIRELRRVLGDQARMPQYIETVHGRGYRFIAPVTAASLGPERHQTAPAVRQPRPSALPGATLFVGREAELAQMSQWWTQARQGIRQVGIIAGEPGIGKTALVTTFVTQVSATESLLVGHGQCVEAYGTGEPYLPVLEALGRLCQGPAGARLVAVLRQYAPSWLVQLPALLPPAEWVGLQRTTDPVTPPRMLRELTDALEAFTTEYPLVLVLEDLHWSDRATLAWLAYVARRPDPARLLLLGTYRPVEAMVHDHPLRTVLTELRQHGQCVELALEYLSEVEVAAYLAQRFGSTRLTAALGRVLHQRTGGNPLFLSALTDELVRQQVVTEGPDGWDVHAGVDALPAIIPAHLRALIEHQLAQLSPEDQQLLEAASVAGVEFAAAAVAAGLERAEEEVEARCTALAHQGQFLQARGPAAWSDGTVTEGYGFRHALYQEVVYQRLPAGRQSRWHARIATRLAQGFGEEAGDMAAAVAMHCVRGRLLSQAVPYLRQAGQHAARRGAHQEAVAFYEQALQALGQLPTTPETQAQAIDLRLDLRTSLLPLGAFRRILDYLCEAETLAEALADRYRLGQVADYMTNHFMSTGDYDRAIASGQRTLALAAALGDFALQVKAHQHLGRAYLAKGDYRQAVDFLQRNVASLQGELLQERFGELNPLAVQSRSWLVLCLAELGEFTEGIARGQEGLHMAEASGQSYSRIDAWTRVGGLYVRKGDLHQAIPLLERGLALCQATHVPLLFPPCAAALGFAYALVGRVTDAIPLLEQAMERNTSMGFLARAAFTLTSLSQVYLLVGRSTEASALARRALALSREHKERGSQAWALLLLGEIAAHGDHPDAAPAARYYRQALALAEDLGMRPLQAHCHNGLGTLYLKIGQPEQARIALATAITLYRAMAMTFWLPQAEAALALLNGHHSRRPEGST